MSTFIVCEISRGGFSCEKTYEFTDAHGNLVCGADQVIRFRYPDGSQFLEEDEKSQIGLLMVHIVSMNEKTGETLIRYWDCMDSTTSIVPLTSLHTLDQ